MPREKQIEEIANILWHIPGSCFLNSYDDCTRIAEYIYDDGGYRKQSEVVKEIFEEINNISYNLMDSPYAFALIKEINRLAEKLMLEIKADTVKKMQKKIIAKSEYGTINISPCQLDQIAKEMLEENNGVH